MEGPPLVMLPERTMVWAWDVSRRELVRINVGDADALRERARADELICPLEQCPHPELTTRRNYVNRWSTFVPDGFRHRVAGAGMHEPESVSHVAAKLMVADWLAAIGMQDIQVERYDTQAQRTPDVTAIHPSGQRFAIEVQYSDLTVALWKERDVDLRKAGLLPIWMWGHSRPEVSADHAKAQLSAIQRSMLMERSQLWWINPEEGALGLAGARRAASATTELVVAPEMGDLAVELDWWPLPGFEVGPEAIEHPQLDRLTFHLEVLRRIQLDSLHSGLSNLMGAIRRETQQALVSGLLGPSEPHRRLPLYKPAGNEVVSVAVETYEVSPEQIRSLAMNGLGPTIEAEYKGDLDVFVPQQRWHAWVVYRLLDGRTPGTAVRVGGIVNALASRVPHDNRRGRLRGAVTDLLWGVERTGFIRVDGDCAIVLRGLGGVTE